MVVLQVYGTEGMPLPHASSLRTVVLICFGARFFFAQRREDIKVSQRYLPRRHKLRTEHRGIAYVIPVGGIARTGRSAMYLYPNPPRAIHSFINSWSLLQQWMDENAQNGHSGLSWVGKSGLFREFSLGSERSSRPAPLSRSMLSGHASHR